MTLDAGADGVAAAAIARYQRERPRYERAGRAVEQIVQEVLAPAGIDALLTCRAKEVSSFRSKIVLKQYADPWAQVTDKVGVRAMVHRAGEVDQIHQLIVDDGRLEIYDVTDKRKGRSWDEFGYSGLHLDLYAPDEDADTERIPCELQLRTAAQHAWSVVSHKLLYKPQVELSTEDKHAIMRLVALVEVFDEEVERVMDRQPSPTPVDQPHRDLASIVTAQYATFQNDRGYEELTRVVLDVVAAALEQAGVEDYQTVLNQFVDSQRADLTQLYADYGAGSEMATVTDYVLWSQPESLALLESLEHRPARLLLAWDDAGLPLAWLRPLAAHTSATIA